MRRWLAVATTLFALLAISPATAATTTPTVRVLTRNLYLGADVGPAMDLLPDFAAAAQFMWDQVQQTDFRKRGPAIAAEMVSRTPDVVAIQEATQWYCTTGFGNVVVYDFLADLLAATKSAGVEYEVAQAGSKARNPGFTIPAIPRLTMVHDPATFRGLFGADDAACGFTISDVLLVRSDLAKSVVAVGNADFAARYSVVPVVMDVRRGYTWADVRISGAVVRFVATHLESLWDPGRVPIAKQQADQLVADFAKVAGPVVVMGDFNSDPRDPREIAVPSDQPVASSRCPEQTGRDATCSPYFTMLAGGWRDSGPSGNTWGFNALLTGPDPARPAGVTDRLDYVWTRGPVTVTSADIFNDDFAHLTQSWSCASICAPSDHAGLVVDLQITSGAEISGRPVHHVSFPGGLTSRILLCGFIAVAAIYYRRYDRRPTRARNS